MKGCTSLLPPFPLLCSGHSTNLAAGYQDNTFRAYDAQSGEELWHYALPVGSSATPMSYVSPKTGRQYVLLPVGAAAHATPPSDLVMAFALPTHWFTYQ